MINEKIAELKPYHRNAKKHPEKQIRQIAESIKEFGFNQPIVVDKNNIIIVGHGRYEAAKILGLEEVPTIKVDLTEEQAKAYRLADNKLNESEWNMELVVDELRELSKEMQELTGFDLDLLIENDEKDDVIPAECPPVAKLGDLWLLGRHRLLCGDATKKEDVEILMNGQKADMVFTDPPYNINYKGRGKNTSNTILSDNVSQNEFDEFLKKVFANLSKSTKDGGGLYIFHSSKTQHQFMKALDDNGYEIKNQLIWNKPSGVLGWGDYQWKHEPFFYAGKKGESIKFYGDRTHSTVWDFQKSERQLVAWAKRQKKLEAEGKTTIWTIQRDNINEYVHPTQKPVELIAYAIKNSTKAEDIVLDFFGGSGSTLIACEKTNRTCYMMELDEKYCDVIIKRYEDYTGQKAQKIKRYDE